MSSLRSVGARVLSALGLAPARSVRALSVRVEKAEARAAAFKREFADARAELAASTARAEELERQLKSAQVAVERCRRQVKAGKAKRSASSRTVATGDETLVMTATIRAESTPTLVIRQEDERLLQYLCALVSWARPRNVRRIVLAENSHTRFDFSGIVRYLEAAGKDVEVLVFDGNKDAARHGKGIGEGEILEYVFNNSKLIRRGEAFYKVTGRIFVRNFDLVSDRTTTADAFYRKKGKAGKKPKVNTVFFKCGLQLFESTLLGAYRQVDEPNGVFIEHLYFDRLRDINPPDFGEPPAFVGQQASTGKLYEAYDADTIRLARSFLPA